MYIWIIKQLQEHLLCQLSIAERDIIEELAFLIQINTNVICTTIDTCRNMIFINFMETVNLNKSVFLKLFRYWCGLMHVLAIYILSICLMTIYLCIFVSSFYFFVYTKTGAIPSIVICGPIKISSYNFSSFCYFYCHIL